MKVLWLWLWLATEWNDELGARGARGSSRQPALVNRALGRQSVACGREIYDSGSVGNGATQTDRKSVV